MNMTPVSAVGRSNWDERIARAHLLAEARPAAAGPLAFYASLAAFQQTLARNADPRSDGESSAVDIDRIVAALQSLLAWLRQASPLPTEPLEEVSDISRDTWRDLVRSYLTAEGWGARYREPGQDGVDDTLDHQAITQDAEAAIAADERLVQFVVEAVLQPFADRLPLRPGPRFDSRSAMRCPRCATLPVAAVLREEGHGSKRWLLCALCLTEWNCTRIVCPACGEREFSNLPVYTAEQFAHVRVDACDGCRHYIKTIDLTKDGLAVPCVDDIASVSLDLWARERGYVRIKRNVLGL